MLKRILINDTRPNMPQRAINFQTRRANNVWWVDVVTTYPATKEEIDRKQVPFLTFAEAVEAIDRMREKLMYKLNEWNATNPDEIARQMRH